MIGRKFQRNIEDFVCGNCGAQIKGDGYTNHCPFCLWSKHVDKNPGDRREECQGMMKPISIQAKKGKQVILHKCQKCGVEKTNKVSETDDFEKILELMKRNFNS
ncbi:MAG: RNHCP domain-containing protein [Candidatus Moranbacteria bacterium]|nr:RNHCP domain-containing protein [Candidatus Moranbacteria bacterium]